MKYPDLNHFIALLDKNDHLAIRVTRFARRDTYTIGHLSIFGEVFSDTLEDRDRGLTQSMPKTEITAKKVYGRTAIPTGTYKVSVQYWSKYKINVPYLHDVPGYTGILIHNGSSDADTLGCILVGENRVKGRLTNGRIYMQNLTTLCQRAIKAGKPVRITVE